jgi:hypothetical protein
VSNARRVKEREREIQLKIKRFLPVDWFKWKMTKLNQTSVLGIFIDEMTKEE